MFEQAEQWYVNLGSHQRGPMPLSDVIRGIKLGKVDASAQVYTKRLGKWTPILGIAELQPYLQRVKESIPPPSFTHHGDGRLDYIIHGDECQYVELALEPGEWCYSESDALIFMEPEVQISTSAALPTQEEVSFFESLSRAYAQAQAREDYTFASYVSTAKSGLRKLALGPSEPGKIVAMELERGRTEHVYAGAGAFFAAGQHVRMEVLDYSANFLNTNYFLHFHGAGTLFLNASGALIQRTLKPGEILNINAESLFAFVGSPAQLSVRHDESSKIQWQGIFEMTLATLTGPMTVWFHTNPVTRRVRHVQKHLPPPSLHQS